MAFDATTALDYTTTVPMVRLMSLLVSTKTDAEIKDALLNHAVPRIAGYLMTAQDSQGNDIFYTALGDLADDLLADRVDQLVAAVMVEPLVAGYIRRIAAALACAYLLAGGAGSFIKSQEGHSDRLEREAMADLKHLIKTGTVSRGVNSALPKLGEIPQSASIYFALEADPTNVNNPYTGATDSGLITATINGFSVNTVISVGDTPTVILNNLAAAINAAQGSGTVNITVGPNEGPITTFTRPIAVVDPFGVSKITPVTYRTNLSSLSIYPFKYDKIVDVATITIQITNDTGGPLADDSLGIAGIIYGVSSNPIDLTKRGPYSVGVDLKTGKTTALDDPNKGLVSDSLFFLGDNPTLSDDTFTYRINGGPVQTVDIPAGSETHKAVEVLAQDLAVKSIDQRILGAVRPSTKLTLNGSPATAPGLSLISVGLDKLYAKYVFTLISCPSGITFGVVPSNLISQGNFDNLTKSVIVQTNIGTAATYTQTQATGETALGKTGNAYVSNHKPTTKLKKLLDMLDNPDGPL